MPGLNWQYLADHRECQFVRIQKYSHIGPSAGIAVQPPIKRTSSTLTPNVKNTMSSRSYVSAPTACFAQAQDVNDVLPTQKKMVN